MRNPNKTDLTSILITSIFISLFIGVGGDEPLIGIAYGYGIPSYPPTITIHFPENKTYTKSVIDLNVSADKIIDTWWYNLNETGNVTFNPNTTVNITNGYFHLIVYANDTYGKVGSEDVYFTIRQPTVCPSGCAYSNIQSAIDNASSGDTIKVGAGTYNGSVLVNKSLNIIGFDNPIVTNGGTIFTIDADNVNISGFKIVNGRTGIFYLRNTRLRLHNNIIDLGTLNTFINISGIGRVDAPYNWWNSVTPNISKINGNGNVIWYPHSMSKTHKHSMRDYLTEFSGDNTTDFSKITSWSIVSLILENHDGLINWTRYVNLKGSSLEFDESIEISHNRIYVNISKMTELDQSAIIIFKNTGFNKLKDFAVYRNGAVCTNSICSNISVQNGDDVTLLVTGLSSYTLVSTQTFLDTVSILLATILIAGALLTFLGFMFSPREMSIRNLAYALIFLLITITLALVFVA